MDKKNLMLLIVVLVAGAFILIGGMFLLLTASHDTIEPTPTEPVETLPDFGGTVTVPTEDLNHQVDNIDKLGFENLSGYWVDKLKEVCDLPAELNKGQTLESLCEYYFKEEYKAYKEALLLGDSKLEECPEEKTNDIYKELIETAVNRNYQEVKYRIEDLMKMYKFTASYNYKIGDLYYDVILLEEIDTMSNATKVKTISTIKTPELQLVEAVRQGYKEQCAMYGNTSSICFESGTHITILSVEEYLVKPNSTDYHEKLMNEYYNFNKTDMPVVKITFKVDFEQSPMKIDSYNGYFKFNNVHYLYDEYGDILLNMDDYSTNELIELLQWYGDYSDDINAEIERRKAENQSNTSLNNTDTNGDFVGMPSGETPETDLSEYDTSLFERHKETIYEAYIPEYSLPKTTYNRIYIINQVDNLDINCLKTIQAHKDILKHNQTSLTFIYQNQWSKMNNSEELEGLQNELLGQGTPD